MLREILNKQPWRFKNYAELTIMKALEAHKDPHKEVCKHSHKSIKPLIIILRHYPKCLLPKVVRAAEETAAMLALSISPDQCIKVLCPIIQSADYPINLAAVKMQTKVVERVPRDGLVNLLPEIVPGLIQARQRDVVLKVQGRHSYQTVRFNGVLMRLLWFRQGYDNSESSVRKACVFCLVAIYTVIGEDLKPHLSQLSSSKVSRSI